MPAAIAEDALFTPTTLGALKLSHRVAFAPMTRNRTIPSEKNPGTWTACPLMCEYYEQRTTPGALMISEAIPVSRQASDGAAPGIYTEEQIEAWGLVVNAVHAAGGVFVAQCEFVCLRVLSELCRSGGY
jgi:2,4-dienoyl-CoA reductase-like NADH-dependent reductase (Old Yellow Enzyme family)